MAKIQEVKSKFTDEQKKIYADIMQKVDDECVKATGMTLQDFIRSTTDKEEKTAPPEAAPKAPAPKTEAAPKAPAPRADDADDPALPPAMRQMLKEKALAVVSSWVEAPTAEHSVQAEQIAKLIENEPEGMLARTAFWSFGNLSVAEPDGTNVPVPPRSGGQRFARGAADGDAGARRDPFSAGACGSVFRYRFRDCVRQKQLDGTGRRGRQGFSRGGVRAQGYDLS